MSILSPKSKAGAPVFQASGADKDAIAKSMGVDPDAEPDVYSFLCRALDAPVPHPWTEHADKKGRVFYWNPASRHSSWEHPLMPSHKSLVAAYRRIMQEEDRQTAVQLELEAFTQKVEEEVGKWRQSHAPDGTPYFYKLGTQITRWDNPRDELMAHMELRVKMLDEIAHQPMELDLPPPMLALGPARTQETLALALVGGTRSPLAIETPDSREVPALADGTVSPARRRSVPSPLALSSGSRLGSSPSRHSDSSPVRNGTSRSLFRRARSTSAASEASDGGSSRASGADSPQSGASTARSIIDFISAGVRRRKGSPERTEKKKKKKKGDRLFGLVNMISPKFRHRQEYAGLKVTRAARRWLAWTRAKKFEAALTVQRLYRGYKGRKAREARVLQLEEERAAELAAWQQLPAEVEEMGKSLHEAMNSPLGRHRARITFDRSQLLPAQGDIDLSAYIFPDEIALQHEMNFDIPVDKAIFNILRPLFLRQLPLPWQILQRSHGRCDFYHAGVQEEKRLHPLHAFFGEVITFLKAHVHTDVPMAEPMTAQIFREASPQFIRQRFGVWEGPHEDASLGGVRYKRLVPAEDKDCAVGENRYDDPRLEAASNVSTRMAAWLHLWLGFVPEEPFPFLEGRLPALAAQVSENVVVAPGAASEALLAHLRGAPPLAVLAVPAHPLLDAKEPEVLPLTKEEEALQPIVTGTLGKAYGAALEFVGKLESGRLEEVKPPPRPVVVEDDESEGEYTELGEEDYEESFAEEEEEDEEEEEQEETSEEEVSLDAKELSEDISVATTAAQTPKSGRRPMQDVETLEKELAQVEVEQQPPKQVESFLPGYNETAACDWATRNLRPLTPKEDRKPPAEHLVLPGTPGNRPWHRPGPHQGQAHLWGDNSLLADSQLRLTFKDPPLEDWGKGPAIASEEAPLPIPVPLSPKDRERAAKALPHLAGPMKKEELKKIRQEQQEKIDDFRSSLMHANDIFDKVLDEAETPPDSPSERWRCGEPDPEVADEFRLRRPALGRPNLPANLSMEFGEAQDDVCPIKGCIATSNTPTKGVMPLPPHLEGVAPIARKGVPKAWAVLRSSSADASVFRLPLDNRHREKLRPRSARARARKPGKSLLPERPSKAAEVAAQSCRRFLSRECGTMQLALNTFDSTGSGRFNRWEWENGLEKLGYEANYDVQEIFTVLDKRQHHVLTLSDLLDHYNGRPITEGLPDMGLKGIASEIVQEAMLEAMGPVVTMALAELLQKELLAPRGPPFTLPNVKALLKKKKERLAQGAEGGDQSRSASPTLRRIRRRSQLQDTQSSMSSQRSGTPTTQAKSPSGRRARKNLTKFKVVGQLMRTKTRHSAQSTEFGSPSSPDMSPGGRHSVAGTANGTLSGPFGGSEKSLAGSPFLATSNRQKGMLSSTGMEMAPANMPAEDNGSKPGSRGSCRQSGSQKTKKASSKSPQPKAPHRSSSSTSGLGQKKGAQKKKSATSQRSGPKLENKYAGFNFVKDDEVVPVQSTDTMGDWQREKLLPWMPRPTEDICRTYGHIFRLLNDPKTKKMSEKPQKKTVQVRMPSLPPVRGSAGRPDSGRSDQESLGPLPSTMTTSSGKSIWPSKSSPDLLSSHLSTTVGSFRPSSAGSLGSEDEPRRMRGTLPKLSRDVNPIDGGMPRRVVA